jgi:hypothetical protein
MLAGVPFESLHRNGRCSSSKCNRGHQDIVANRAFVSYLGSNFVFGVKSTEKRSFTTLHCCEETHQQILFFISTSVQDVVGVV